MQLVSQDGKIAFKFEEEFLRLCKMERRILYKDGGNIQIEKTDDQAHSRFVGENGRQPTKNSFAAVIPVDTAFFSERKKAFDHYLIVFISAIRLI